MTWLLFLSPDFLIPSLLFSPSSHFPSSSLTPARLYSLFTLVSRSSGLSKSDFFFPFCISWWWMSHFSLPICIVFSFHSIVSPLDADKSHLFHQVFMGVCGKVPLSWCRKRTREVSRWGKKFHTAVCVSLMVFGDSNTRVPLEDHFHFHNTDC